MNPFCLFLFTEGMGNISFPMKLEKLNTSYKDDSLVFQNIPNITNISINHGQSFHTRFKMFSVVLKSHIQHTHTYT